MKKIPKDYQEFANAAIEAGWRIRQASGHAAMVLYPADKSYKPITICGSPCPNPRSVKNKRSEFRRAGLPV